MSKFSCIYVGICLFCYMNNFKNREKFRVAARKDILSLAQLLVKGCVKTCPQAERSYDTSLGFPFLMIMLVSVNLSYKSIASVCIIFCYNLGPLAIP